MEKEQRIKLNKFKQMKSIVQEKILKATENAGYKSLSDFDIMEPPQKEMGDFATNAALVLGKKEGKAGREIAEKIRTLLLKDEDISRVEIAGPGFINITLKEGVYLTELSKILEKRAEYGKENIGQGEKVNVEFVSANPTGPLHVGNARGGPIGESIANLYDFLGFKSIREFYINDIGGQVEKFAKSLYWHFEIKSNPKAEFPEGGYPGEYIKEISKEVQKQFADEIEAAVSKEEQITVFKKRGLDIIISGIKNDLNLIGIDFDVWFRQSLLEKDGEGKKIVDVLKKKGSTTEKDGALWLKNPSDPDLQDRESVLVKGDGSLTYFADDIAYHINKIDRGAKKLIDIWGANHFGHIPRMKAALRLLDQPEETLEIILYQYVRLKKSGQAVSMGKRLGNFVTLRQVIEAGVAPDAFKYFILAQNPNTPMDFDIDLAADTSEKNPVYYIKYAHARICSILKKAGDREETAETIDLTLLKDPKELALIKELTNFSELVLAVKDNFQMQTLPHYAYKIAGLFHDFYSNCQVLTDNKELTKSRIALILATKYILKNTLNILGIDAPEKM